MEATGGTEVVDPVAALCIAVGLLVIIGRGPLVFAPQATIRFYERMLSTDARIRGLGVVMAVLALALLVPALGEGTAAGLLRLLGWIFAGATVWLLAAPGSYRLLAQGVLEFMEHSVDSAVVRGVGIFAVGLGLALIYVGLFVV